MFRVIKKRPIRKGYLTNKIIHEWEIESDEPREAVLLHCKEKIADRPSAEVWVDALTIHGDHYNDPAYYFDGYADLDWDSGQDNRWIYSIYTPEN